VNPPVDPFGNNSGGNPTGGVFNGTMAAFTGQLNAFLESSPADRSERSDNDEGNGNGRALGKEKNEKEEKSENSENGNGLALGKTKKGTEAESSNLP
jgi:hypothetical protein